MLFSFNGSPLSSTSLEVMVSFGSSVPPHEASVEGDVFQWRRCLLPTSLCGASSCRQKPLPYEAELPSVPAQGTLA